MGSYHRLQRAFGLRPMPPRPEQLTLRMKAFFGFGRGPTTRTHFITCHIQVTSSSCHTPSNTQKVRQFDLGPYHLAPSSVTARASSGGGACLPPQRCPFSTRIHPATTSTHSSNKHRNQHSCPRKHVISILERRLRSRARSPAACAARHAVRLQQHLGEPICLFCCFACMIVCVTLAYRCIP